MRLIDADALREYIYECDGPMTHKAVARAIDIAPTVECAECEHSRPCDCGQCGQSFCNADVASFDWDSVTPDFGCVRFERRHS